MSRLAVKAISFLWLSSLGGAGIAFLTQVFLARTLGPAEYGVLSAALVLVGLFLPVAGFGASQFILKVYGQEGWGATRWLGGILQFNSYSTLVALAVLGVCVLQFDTDSQFRIVSLTLFLHLLGQVYLELVGSKMQLEESYVQLAIWQITPHFVRLIFLVLALVFFGYRANAIGVAVVYGIVGAVVASYGVLVLRKVRRSGLRLVGHGVKPDTHDDALQFPSSRDVLKGSWPFGLAALFHLIYFQSNILQIRFFVGNVEAGLYNVAFSIMAAVYLLPSVVYQRFLVPKLHRWVHHDREKLYEIYKKGNVLMLLIGSSATAVIYFISEFLVLILFGNKYEGAVELVRVLAFSAPSMFVAFSAGAMLVTNEHVKRKVVYMGFVAVMNASLNFLFIPEYGILAAAYVTILSNTLLMLAYLHGAYFHVFKGERG